MVPNELTPRTLATIKEANVSRGMGISEGIATLEKGTKRTLIVTGQGADNHKAS
jgi:hypothetical protein